MRKNVNNKIINIKRMSNEKKVSLAATVISVILILVGIIGLFLVQTSLDQSQDLRQQASVDQGQATLTSRHIPPQDTVDDLVVGQQESIDFYINTGGLQVDGMQFVFNIITDDFESSPEVVIDPASNLEAAYQEVQQTADGYLVGLILHNSQFGTFGASQETRIFSLRFTPKTAGTVTFSFDRERSQALAANTDPIVDELTHVDTFVYTAVDLSGGGTPTPTASPTTSPTASPTVSPTVQPTTTTTTQTTVGVGGATLASCNQGCANNNDCQANFRCYQGNCRLVTNVSSSSCQNPGSQGLQKGCNQTCNNTGECAAGYMCYQGNCRNPINATNTSCANVTVIVQEQMAASCDQSCTSNNQCAANLTCYQGSCRLATNPSSLSCSPTTQTTVSTTYDKGGSASTSPSPTPAATVSAIPSVSPIASATATPIGNAGFLNTSTTPSPTARTSPVPLAEITDQESSSALADIIENFKDRGNAFPLAMIGSGLFLVLLVILFFFLRRRGGNNQKPPQQMANPAYKQQVQNLQSRINQLQQNPNQTPPTSVAPSMPMPGTPPPPPAPTPAATPTPAAPNQPFTPPMIQKLQERGTAFGPGQQVPPNK